MEAENGTVMSTSGLGLMENSKVPPNWNFSDGSKPTAKLLGSGEKSNSTPTVGLRFNAGKPPIFRGFINYFPRAMEAVSQVSAFGAEKYAWDNWQHIKDGVANCSDSLGRHLVNEAKGRTNDAESELLEASHTAWNAMARLEFICKEQENNSST